MKRILCALAFVCALSAFGQTGETPAYITIWVGNAVQTTYDLGIYTDNNGQPGALQCDFYGIVVPPSNSEVTFPLHHCPIEPFGAQIWLGAVEGDNADEQGAVAGNCAGTNSTAIWSPNSASSLPTAFPSGGTPAGHGCYQIFVTFADGSTCGLNQQTATDNGNGDLVFAEPCIVPASAPVWYQPGQTVSLSCDPSVNSTSADPGAVTIARSVDGSGVWTTLTTTAGPDCAYSDSTIDPSTTYDYVAFFVQDGEVSTPSNTSVIAINSAEPPHPPVTPPIW